MKINVSFATFAIMTGLLTVALPAHAQEPAASAKPGAFAPAPTPGDSSVSVPTAVNYDGHTLMRIRTDVGGMTAGQRVNKIHERMASVLTDPYLVASDVRVRPSRFVRGGADILVAGRLLVVVDPALGEANGASATDLARLWAADLKKSLPEINVYNRDAARRTYVAKANR